MSVLNQYSFALLCLLIFAAAATLILRHGVTVRQILWMGLVAAVLLAAWYVLRPQPGTRASRTEILNQIGRGTPVLIEMQSPY